MYPFNFSVSSTNLDTAFDEHYHSESEFYYPDETENYNEKENISSIHDENRQSAEFTMDSVQEYILTQRTENTVRQTDFVLNVSFHLDDFTVFRRSS